VASAVTIAHTPRYQAIASHAAALAGNGASPQTIASVLCVTRELASRALDFARTGKVVAASRGVRKRTGTAGGPPKYVQIAEEVARRRDSEQMSFAKIAKLLRVGESTVIRAYDLTHKTALAAAIETGGPPDRGRYSHLGAKRKAGIARRLKSGEPIGQIAVAVGCSSSTVRRVDKERRSKAHVPENRGRTSRRASEGGKGAA
jgi:hypothetical protein